MHYKFILKALNKRYKRFNLYKKSNQANSFKILLAVPIKFLLIKSNLLFFIMFESMKKGYRDLVTKFSVPPSESFFYEKGTLTPDEFIVACD